MLLIALTLSLLVIVAGMKLLAQSQKDNLGNLFKYVSMFVIGMGFLSILCVFGQCAMRCCHRGEHKMMMMHQRCMMNDDDCDDNGCYDMRSQHHMMNCQHGMMNDGCCPMQNGSCGMHNGCSNMGGCSDKMGSCKDDGGMENCPMMKDGHCAKGDSACTNVKK